MVQALVISGRDCTSRVSGRITLSLSIWENVTDPLLGATGAPSTVLDEVIPWVKQEIELGRI